MGNNDSKFWDEDDDRDFFDTKPSEYGLERRVQRAIDAQARAELEERGGEALDSEYEDSVASMIMYQTAGMRMRAVRNVPVAFMTGIQFQGKTVMEMTESFNAGMKTWETPPGKFSFDIFTRLKPESKKVVDDGYYDSDDDDWFDDDANWEKDDKGNMTGICTIFIVRRPDPVPEKKRGRPRKETVQSTASADGPKKVIKKNKYDGAPPPKYKLRTGVKK